MAKFKFNPFTGKLDWVSDEAVSLEDIVVAIAGLEARISTLESGIIVVPPPDVDPPTVTNNVFSFSFPFNLA